MNNEEILAAQIMNSVRELIVDPSDLGIIEAQALTLVRRGFSVRDAVFYLAHSEECGYPNEETALQVIELLDRKYEAR
jgi:hypothetical protein